jgi:hypothetical protein
MFSTMSESHTAACLVGTGGIFPWGKVAKVTVIFVLVPRLMNGLYLSTPILLHDLVLRHR